MPGYYDVLLVLLPASLFGLSGTLYAVGLGLTLALTCGGLVATGLTAHGLFVNDPSSDTAESANQSTAALESVD